MSDEHEAVEQAPAGPAPEAVPAVDPVEGWLATLEPGALPRAAPSTVLALQRAAGNRAVGRLLRRVAPPLPDGHGMGVEFDDPPIGDPSDFLDALEQRVTATAEAALPPQWTAAGCPWIEYWINHYRESTVDEILDAIRRYAPDATSATDRDGVIDAICDRVQAAIEEWVANGADIPILSPQPQTQTLARKIDMGPGRTLDAGVRSRMGAAFGRDFSSVRVHDAAGGQAVAASMAARAVTVGTDIAFGRGQYEPGTLMGDALIAHELAHVVQQENPGLQRRVDDAAAERDADRAVMDVLLGSRAAPRVRSGLTPSRCGLLFGPDPPQPAGVVHANAVTTDNDSRFAPDDTPGRMPVSWLVDGGSRIRLDGDGDEMKELELFVRETRTGPDQRAREMSVDVELLATHETHSAHFNLPEGEFNGGPSFVTVQQVTDGFEPTRISLVLPSGVQVLLLHPGRRAQPRISYALELESHESTNGTDTSTVGQRQVVDFLDHDPAHAVFDAPAAATLGVTSRGARGALQVGDVWALDMNVGPYGDQFRFSFRQRPEGGTAEMGVSVLDAHTHLPVGGHAIPLTTSGTFAVTLLPNDGISAAIDLNNDGIADVQVFDRLTQAGYDNPGPVGRNRIHDLHVVGPAVARPQSLRFEVELGMISAGSTRGPAADFQAASDAAAFSGLGRQRGMRRADDELATIDLQLNQLIQETHGDGLISDTLFGAWRTCVLDFATLDFQRAHGGVPADVREQMAVHGAAFHDALYHDTPSESDPETGMGQNIYTDDSWGSGDDRDTGRILAAQIRAERWDDAQATFRTLVAGIARWSIERNRDRWPSGVEGRPETQRGDVMEQVLGQRQLIASIRHHNPQRMRAVFHPRVGWDEGGQIREIPLSLYFWREDDEWKIKDCTSAAESPTYTADAQQNETEPSAAAMQRLDSDHHFQVGLVRYVMPSGAAGQVQTTGPSAVIHWLTMAGIATAAIGLGLLTAGAGTAAIVAFTISGLIGATTAAIDLGQRHANDTLTFGQATLDVAQIVAGLAAGPTMAAGRLLNGARLAAAAGAAVEATAVLRAANTMWVPLQISLGTADAVQGIVMIGEAYDHMRQIRSGQGSDADKERALHSFLLQLAVTGGLTVLSVRGASAEVLAGRPLSIETVNGSLFAVPSTRSVQGRRIDEARSAMEAAQDEPLTQAWRRREYLATIERELGQQGPAFVDVERLALAGPGAGLTMDATGLMRGAGDAADRLETLANKVVSANNAAAAHGIGREFQLVIEPAGAGGVSRVTVVGAPQATRDTEAVARQLVASGEGRLQAMGPLAVRLHAVDPHLRVETSPEGLLRIEKTPDLDVVALTRSLGGTPAAEALVGDLGAALPRLMTDMAATEVAAMARAHGAPSVRWAGAEFAGQRASALLDSMHADVAAACRKALGTGGVTPTVAETLVTAYTDATLQRVVTAGAEMSQAAALLGQQERRQARDIVEEFLARNDADGLRRFMQSSEHSVTRELAAATELGANQIVVDTNVLAPVRAYIGGIAWNQLQAIERRDIEVLFQSLGTPLAAAAGGGVVPPTVAQVEAILPRLRASATVLGEAGITQRYRVPGAGGAPAVVHELVVPRVTGVAEAVDRTNDPQYRAVLDELMRPPARPWTPAANIRPGHVTDPLGEAVGFRDRSVVADVLFAQTAAGGPMPTFITSDARVFEPLAGWAVPGTIHPPPHGAGSIAQRLARANPNGFEINLLGRRMKVIPVGL